MGLLLKLHVILILIKHNRLIVVLNKYINNIIITLFIIIITKRNGKVFSAICYH